MDPFFGLLATSRYAIPADMLGDAAKAQTVADAITFQHGIIRAQVLSWEQRLSANNTNATLADTPENIQDSSDAIDYHGIIIDPNRRRRLVQDAAATRVLEAFLGATVLFSALGWLLMRKTNLLPRNSTCIASVAALLADGNLFQFLPKDAMHMKASQLAQAFPPGMIFRLGWGQVRTQSGVTVDRFMVCAVLAGVEDEVNINNNANDD